MLTQYDMNKKTTIDIFLPIEFKDKINATDLLSLLNSEYKMPYDVDNNYIEDDSKYRTYDRVFGNLSIEELYELETVIRKISSVINNRNIPMYMLTTVKDDSYTTNLSILNYIIKKYINKRTGSDYLLDAMHEDIVKDYVEKIKDTDNGLYEYVKVNNNNVLYLDNEILIPILLGDEVIVNEKLFKIVNELITIIRDKYLGNNPDDIDAYMLPYYVYYNIFVSNKIKISMKDIVGENNDNNVDE